MGLVPSSDVAVGREQVGGSALDASTPVFSRSPWTTSRSKGLPGAAIAPMQISSAQGVVNMASAEYGGNCVTGTIAAECCILLHGLVHDRGGATCELYPACGDRLGARGRLLEQGPEECVRDFLIRAPALRGDALLLLATFLIAMFRDSHHRHSCGLQFSGRFSSGIAWRKRSGWRANHRSSRMTEPMTPTGGRKPFDVSLATDPGVLVYWNFPAPSSSAQPSRASPQRLIELASSPRAYVVDFSAVPVIDFDRGRRPSRASPARAGATKRRFTSRCAARCPAHPRPVGPDAKAGRRRKIGVDPRRQAWTLP